MSDIVKWGLLAAGAIALIALIVALPFTQYLNTVQLGSMISAVIDIAGDALYTARGLVNNFLHPFGREILTGIMLYLLGRWVVTLTIKITAWIYHYVFKG